MDEEKKPTLPDSGDENQGRTPRRPARPPRKKRPVYEDLEEGDLVEALKEYLGEDLLSAQSFLKQNIYTVSSTRLLETMVFLKEDCGFDYLVDLTALDYLGDDDPQFEELLERIDVTNSLECLNSKERTIIHLKYYSGLSQTAIASRLGISQMHVSRLQRNALDKLKLELNG